MTERATYRKLISPIAQIEAAEDFVGQMQSVVADVWRERDTPEDTARATSESAIEFLEDLEEGEWDSYVLDVMAALGRCGMRFDSDNEEDAEGYFLLKNRGRMLDTVLHRLAELFSEEVKALAPEGWETDDTFMCLGWENLVLVPLEDESTEFVFDPIVGSEKAN